MRQSIVPVFVLLWVWSCFVSNSRGSELKDISTTSKLTSSFSVDDASAKLEGAMPRYNETESGTFAVDESDAEARGFTNIEKLLESAAHLMKRYAVNQKNLLKDRTMLGKHKSRPNDKLVKEMNSLQMKSQRTKEDNEHLLSLIQMLQDDHDFYLQQTGDAGLMNMLRSGFNKNVQNAQSGINKELGEESEYREFDQELAQAWSAYVFNLLETNEVTAKQTRIYASLLTDFTEKELAELAVAIKMNPKGEGILRRFLLVMTDDPVTRDLAFRLQWLSSELDVYFLMDLIIHENQNPDSLPLNVWLEYVAYSRFSSTFIDPTELRRFAEYSFFRIEFLAGVSRPQQKEMFTAIAENKAYELNIPMKETEMMRAFEWDPDVRNEIKRCENYFLEDERVKEFTNALDNQVVVQLFRAAEVVDKVQVLAEVQKDPIVAELLSVSMKDDDSITLFKAALRDRQVKKLAKELLEFIDNESTVVSPVLRLLKEADDARLHP